MFGAGREKGGGGSDCSSLTLVGAFERDLVAFVLLLMEKGLTDVKELGEVVVVVVELEAGE